MNDVLYHGLHEAVQDDRSYCDRRMVEICIKSTRTSVLMIVAKLVLAVVAVSSHALHIKTPSFIDHANWMRDLMPVIGNASLFDLSLPGTHDTFTYDLSTTV